MKGKQLKDKEKLEIREMEILEENGDMITRRDNETPTDWKL